MANQITTTSLVPTNGFVSSTSRYAQSSIIYYGSKNYITFPTYKITEIPLSNTDKYTVISSSTEYRPDLVSNQAYGVPDFWWKIMEAITLMYDRQRQEATSDYNMRLEAIGLAESEAIREARDNVALARANSRQFVGIQPDRERIMFHNMDKAALLAGIVHWAVQSESATRYWLIVTELRQEGLITLRRHISNSGHPREYDAYALTDAGFDELLKIGYGSLYDDAVKAHRYYAARKIENGSKPRH